MVVRSEAITVPATGHTMFGTVYSQAIRLSVVGRTGSPSSGDDSVCVGVAEGVSVGVAANRVGSIAKSNEVGAMTEGAPA